MNEALQRAAATGDGTSVKRLLSQGVDVNIPDDSEHSASMYSYGQGHGHVSNLMIAVGVENVYSLDSNISILTGIQVSWFLYALSKLIVFTPHT